MVHFMLTLLLTTIVEASPPTLSISELTVTLDEMLPRPRTIVYKTANLTASTRHTENHTGAAEEATDMCLNTVIDVGCAGPGLGKVATNASAGICCALCKRMGRSKCTAWTWNGPNGNLVHV